MDPNLRWVKYLPYIYLGGLWNTHSCLYGLKETRLIIRKVGEDKIIFTSEDYGTNFHMTIGYNLPDGRTIPVRCITAVAYITITDIHYSSWSLVRILETKNQTLMRRVSRNFEGQFFWFLMNSKSTIFFTTQILLYQTLYSKPIYLDYSEIKYDSISL